MLHRNRSDCVALCLLTLLLVASPGVSAQNVTGPAAIDVLPGMPPVIDPSNLYGEASAGRLGPAVGSALPRVYVPNVKSGTVDVIDPETLTVVDRLKAGQSPQHVVPSWDLRTLWVTSSADRRHGQGSLLPIDPISGQPGRPIPVPDAYNMYFMPDGSAAIVVAEARRQLELRDPETMALRRSIQTPQCRGLNHADFSIDGRYAIFTCEFGGSLVKVDLIEGAVIGTLRLSKGGMPQDIRISPDGKVFYVADMRADGVFVVDGESLTETGFIPTGPGTHGLYPSRDGTKLYVANRGSHRTNGAPHGPGSVSVIDFATRKVEATWHIPGGGSPDMGNVSADGKRLWLSGRYDGVVYVIDTATGEMETVPVGRSPHGLTVWPQPGRYSLGHTGNMR
ncbi:YncE family protein [Microvirga calopogonii]|uniref:YVTN family beta-propeller repeat protein n=1 Tax=Microvirga calopogonii TaxID=2078013 RepID=UPI000E0CDBD7|nr:YncE family protein [Microvirga calopogonii]